MRVAELKLSKRFVEKSPNWLFALVSMIYWGLPPNPQKVLIVPVQNWWLFYWKGSTAFLTSPKFRIGVYKQNTRYLRIEPSDMVLDVGACIGGFTIPASFAVGKKGFVVAIEPEPKNLDALKKASSNLDNVHIVEKCAWSHRGKLKLYIDETNPGGHSLVQPKSGRTIKIQADTLDNIVAEIGMKRVDFIKMDIEGAELEALEGARKILKSARKVVVECHHINGKPTWPKVQQFLKNNGFKTYVEDGIVHAWK